LTTFIWCFFFKGEKEKVLFLLFREKGLDLFRTKKWLYYFEEREREREVEDKM
jgi:hypothetical protein